MRFIRLGALVGSVVLLVATTVSLMNHRSDARQRQDGRATAAVQLGVQSAWSTIARAMAVADLGNAETDPAAVVESFEDGASACIVAGTQERCTDVDLVALAAFGEGAAASVELEEPAIVVDESDQSVLVVARDGVTTAIRLPFTALIGQVARDVIAGYDAAVEVRLDTDEATELTRVGPDLVDGIVVVTDTAPLPGEGGSMVVTASIEDSVGIAGGNLGLYVVLLALGTILMALAGWTFLLDRRTLERRATTDELTRLANRREFERQTDEALLTADRFNTGVCVMLIDLNGFKQINDTLGHLFGDQVLQSAAERLTASVRETDLVARWGGDEFVILLPGIEDGTGVRASAERIGRSLAETPIVGDVTVTAAIGAALFPRHGTTLDDLIRAADVAMYSAKSTGVVYRLADILDVGLAAERVQASGYRGPDRRRASVTDDAEHQDA